MTIEALCMELGTPAAYVEDEVENLVSNQLMKEVSSGKYQTDFVILPWEEPKDNTNIAQKIYGACFPGYFDALTAFLEGHKALLSGGKFNTAGFSWDRLLWVYLHVVTEFVLDRFRVEEFKIVPYCDMPKRPNGGKWIALGSITAAFSNAGIRSRIGRGIASGRVLCTREPNALFRGISIIGAALAAMYSLRYRTMCLRCAET